MAASTTLTIRISEDLKQKLERLATATRRSKSFLAGEALERYVAYEMPIVEKILEGLEDVKAGRVVPHEQVMDEVDAIIEAAIARRKSA